LRAKKLLHASRKRFLLGFPNPKPKIEPVSYVAELAHFIKSTKNA